MNTFPCRDCGKRTPDCHASCPAYLSYKAKREAQLAAYKKERRGYDSAVAHIRASRPCTGGDYEQLKTRLKLCGMTGAEYEDAVRELREALDMV